VVVAALVAGSPGGPVFAEPSAEATAPEAAGAASTETSGATTTETPSAASTGTSGSTTAASDVLPLSLHEAIALGIENNTDVQLIRYDPPIAEYDYEAAWGLHDPTAFAEYTYRSTNLPVASTFFPGQFVERVGEGSGGLTGLIPKLGWTYDVSYYGDSTSTNSFVQTLGKTYTSNVTARVNAPILRGAWWGGAWTEVQLTNIGTGVALEQFRRRLMDIVGGLPGIPIEQNLGIENAYWTLAAREQDLEVAGKSLETARELLRQTKAQYDVGVVSRVEVTEAEAGVATREFNRITAENRYWNAQDELIDRVFGPRLTPTSLIKIEPTDRPENYVTFSLDPELSTQRALERRPELEIAQQRVEQREISLKFAKNERLPQLDLVGSYGTHGLSGNQPNCPFGTQQSGANCIPNDPMVPTFQPQQPSGIGTDYSDSSDFWFKGNDNRIWTGGARFSIPIPNTTARSRVGISELELRRAKTFVRRTEQDIVKEIRDAVRNLNSALEGIEAAERSVAAFTEQLRAEKIRLEHGESTPFDVLLREQDLVEAESQRIGALRVYHGSVTALDRAQGTLLEDRGILLDDALQLR
jgi:outer membrane protein TolC